MKDSSFPDHDKMMDMLLEFSKIIEANKNKEITIAKEYDVSNILQDDTIAKLQLTVGEVVIIPVDKLKEYLERVNR